MVEGNEDAFKPLTDESLVNGGNVVEQSTDQQLPVETTGALKGFEVVAPKVSIVGLAERTRKSEGTPDSTEIKVQVSNGEVSLNIEDGTQLKISVEDVQKADKLNKSVDFDAFKKATEQIKTVIEKQFSAGTEVSLMLDNNISTQTEQGDELPRFEDVAIDKESVSKKLEIIINDILNPDEDNDENDEVDDDEDIADQPSVENENNKPDLNIDVQVDSNDSRLVLTLPDKTQVTFDLQNLKTILGENTEEQRDNVADEIEDILNATLNLKEIATKFSKVNFNVPTTLTSEASSIYQMIKESIEAEVDIYKGLTSIDSLEDEEEDEPENA